MPINPHIDRTDVTMWLQSPVTLAAFGLILDRFNHQQALMGAEPGTSIDRFRGRAEVLAYLDQPQSILGLFPPPPADIENMQRWTNA